MVSSEPQPLYPTVGGPKMLVNRRLGGPKSRSSCFVDEKDLVLQLTIKPRYICRLALALVICQLLINHKLQKNSLSMSGTKFL